MVRAVGHVISPEWPTAPCMFLLLFLAVLSLTAARNGNCPEEGPNCHAAVDCSGVLVEPCAVLVFRRAVADYAQGTDARCRRLLWIATGFWAWRNF